jgi:class 3 adenylate cyclase/tetratricopeptide (TPR) repeat protein
VSENAENSSSAPMGWDIGPWLRELGLEKYVDVFAANDVDLRALRYLTEADLRELGVSLGHRRILMAAVAKFAQTTAEGTHKDKAIGTLAAPAPIASEEKAERRLLSVFFCDLVGSTELSRQLDAEELREVLRSYQDQVTRAVTRYGGHVAKYLGDGVMAYFGWPSAYEDHAERAIRAGLEALVAVQSLRSKNGFDLQARVGVATGRVVVGDLISSEAREEGAISGETPNLAARLQASAQPKQLIIAEVTRRLVGEAFVVEDLGEKSLKGFGSETRLYVVLSEREVVSRFHAAHGEALWQFVGRFHELALLLERWELAKAGEGQAILLSGEAGIGKSRLVQAFCEKLSSEQHTIIRLQCSPYHTNSVLFPVIQSLMRIANFRPSDTNEQRLDKLEHMLREVGADVETVAPVYAELLSIPSHERYGELELPPQQRKTLTLQTLVDRFLRRAGHSPVLLIVEDAHWIDPTTTELLEELIARIEKAPVMLLVTHRPNWRSEWSNTYSHVMPLTIGRLAKPQVAELARNIAGDGASSRLIDQIVARTDGIPLFIEELTRSLIESKIDNGSVGTEIPATLQGFLMARLDRLPPVAKQTAQIASIIGREFGRNLLTSVCDFPSVELDDALNELVAAHLVMRAGSADDVLAFKHALIQDTAYHSLLSSKRQRYHEIIARKLIEDHSVIAEMQPELIARHFYEAKLPDRALPFLRRAGERALARSANYEAIDHYEKALALASGLSDISSREDAVVEAKIALGRAQAAAGLLQQAMVTFNDASRQARAQRKAIAFANCALGFGQAQFYAGDSLDPSIQLLTEAVSMIGKEDSQQRCQLLSSLGRSLYLMGRSERADVLNIDAIEMARRLNDDGSLFEILANTFMASAALSDIELNDRRMRLDELLTITDRLRDVDRRARALAFSIYYSAEIGDREGMDRALNEFCSLSESRQMLHHQWAARHGRAMQAILTGNFTIAEELAEEAYAMGRRTHGENVDGLYGMQLFTIRREQGRLQEIAPIIKRFVDKDDAERNTWRPGFAVIAVEVGFKEQAQRVLDEFRETKFSFPMDGKRSTTLSYLADVCTALEDDASARELYTLLEPYRKMTITAGIVTVCYGSAGRFLGNLAGVLGDWNRAEEHFEDALRSDEVMQAWPWLAHTQHDFARMLRGRGRQDDIRQAGTLTNQSWETATRLDMTALKQKLRAQQH